MLRHDAAIIIDALLCCHHATMSCFAAIDSAAMPCAPHAASLFAAMPPVFQPLLAAPLRPIDAATLDYDFRLRHCLMLCLTPRLLPRQRYVAI